MRAILVCCFSMFVLGSSGMFLYRKHFIIILLSLELILLSLNILLVCFSVMLDDLYGQLFSLFTLTVAAAETSLGLALIIVFYKLRGGIAINLVNLLKS